MAGGGAHVKGVGIPIICFDFSQKSKRKSLLTLSHLEIVNVWSMEDNSVI